MTDLFEIIEDATTKFTNALEDLPRVKAAQVGLDSRAGRFYVDTDNNLIIVSGTSYIRALDYYGGFEYVEEEAVTTFGEYKIYDGSYSERVANAIDFYLENEKV